MSRINGMMSREECRRRYEEGLAQFAQPGNRDYMVTHGGFVNWGKGAGLSAEDIIEDAHAAGVTNRDGSIRTAWESSTMRPDDGTTTMRPYRPTRAKVKPAPGARSQFAVKALVGDRTEADRGCAEWIMELSPDQRVLALPQNQQTTAFLRASFAPDEYLYMFANLKREDGTEYATPGRVGESFRRCADWVMAFESGTATGVDHVVPNPLSGLMEKTKKGKLSYVAVSCLAAFPFLVIEFDAMPLPWQYAFWRSFITRHPLAPMLAAIVFSGHKSLHGLLHVGSGTRAEWDKIRLHVAALFDADRNPKTTPADVLMFCADGQAMQPRQGVRLPGVRRCDDQGRHTGAIQTLLYLNPSMRDVKGWS